MTTKRVVGVALGATAAGMAGGAAVLRAAIRRRRRRPDPAAGDDFTELVGTRHRSVSMGDGAEIDVVERGRGRPFVLLHGVTMSTLSWHYQLIDLVEAGYRVLAPDVRGHGRSTGGDDGYTIGRLAEDVYEVLRTLDVRDAIVVGHSLGGMTILQLLSDHPELAADGTVSAIVLASTSASPVIGNGVPAVFARVARLITPAAGRGHAFATARHNRRARRSGQVAAGSDPAHTPAGTGGTVIDGPAVGADGSDRVAASDDLARSDLAGIDAAAMYCRLAFGASPSPTHIELVRALTSAVPPEVLSPLILALARLDVRKLLPAMDAPTLVVVGQRDLVTPVWHSRYLASRIPQADLVVLPGTGHMVQFERRAEFLDLLVGWAERWPGGPPPDLDDDVVADGLVAPTDQAPACAATPVASG